MGKIHNTLKFRYKKAGNHVLKCYRCGVWFEEGQMVTRTQTAGSYKYRCETPVTPMLTVNLYN